MFLNRSIISRSVCPTFNSSRAPNRWSSSVAVAATATRLHDKPQERKAQETESLDEWGNTASSDPEESALTRRFTAMAEEAITSSPRKASQITSENIFSEELKRQLEERIASAKFASIHAQTLSTASIPPTAPKQARDIASSAAWTGTESTGDAVLRMIVDTHKPLRGELARKPKSSLTPSNIDIRPAWSSRPQSVPQRLANAREKSTEYTFKKSETLSESERAEVRNMFRERFMPEGRAITSLNAIASLADEKIEEARRRGQFKNLPRGKPLERDHNADSPFLDTTEYFMNRIIQKQDIVPPWIEKQQDLAKAVRVFRERLRKEWCRHVARAVASAGGSLEEQCRQAEGYAAGEARLARAEVGVKETGEAGGLGSADGGATGRGAAVFRDAAWEKSELRYHKLAIENLNSMARSYNLMAPELAKKPYFILEREMKSCFRESAPLIAQEIRGRAELPAGRATRYRMGNPGAILGQSGGAEKAAIYDSTKPNYGMKELWKDIFGGWKWGRQSS